MGSIEKNYFAYLNEKDLKHIKNFKYSCKNDSILYNNITSPILDKYFVNYLPRWIAPNVLTALSFFFNFVTFIVVLFEVGNDFTIPISRSTCFLQFITHMLYIILDNADGKQARRTNSSSPLGLLFDHGFDVLTTCIVAYNISHMIMLGNSTIKSSLLFFALYTGFWANVYEEYEIKFMHLGVFNGADEGNLIIAMSALLSSIFGVEIWSINIYAGYTISEIMITLLCFGTLQTVFQCIQGIMNHKKNFGIFITFLFDSINFALCISMLYVTFYFDHKTYSNYTSYLYLLVSLTFSRITLEMQINIIANRKYKLNHMVFITHLIWLISIFYKDTIHSFVEVRNIFHVLIFINLSSFIFFALNVLQQIKNYLGIKIFTI
jgi:ethanolaminephosphotransferase